MHGAQSKSTARPLPASAVARLAWSGPWDSGLKMWTAAAGPLPGPVSITSSCRGQRACRGTVSGVLGVLLVVAACFVVPRLLRPGSPSGAPSPGPADVPSARESAASRTAAAPARRTSAFRQVQLGVPKGMLTGCTQTFTMEQVLRHDSADDDCWVVVHGKVRYKMAALN